MGLLDSIQGKWYSLLDAIAAKGVPVYSVVDPLEKMGVPSLYAFIAITLLVVGIAAFVLMAPSGGTAYSITVTANGAPLPKAKISVTAGGAEVAAKLTNAEGKATLTAPAGATANVTAEGCEPLQKALTPGENKITLQCGKTPVAGACLDVPVDVQFVELYGEGAQPATGCAVSFADSEGTPKAAEGWEVDGNKLYFPENACLNGEDTVSINCDSHALAIAAKDLIAKVQTTNRLTLESKAPAALDPSLLPPPGSDLENTLAQATNTPELLAPEAAIDDNGDGIDDTANAPTAANGYATQLITIIVLTSSGDGTPLDGIVVQAASGTGSALNSHQNADKQCITSGGACALQLAAGQKFRVTATDPNGAYAPATSGESVASGAPRVTLVMKTGAPTAITVTDQDGKPVPGATIFARKAKDRFGPFSTDGAGKATITLDSGVDYDIDASKQGYLTDTQSVSGGGNADFKLTKLDSSNSGSVVLEVINTELNGEPYEGVNVALVNSKGATAAECITPANGLCSFSQVYAGKYDAEAMPRGAYEPEKAGSVEVKAGRNNKFTVEVTPPDAGVRIKTFVDGQPAEGVEVTMWTVNYNQLEDSKKEKSDKYREVQFKTSSGKTHYFQASYRQGATSYLANYGPVKVVGDIEVSMQLTAPKADATLDAPKDMAAGSTGNAVLCVGMPYLDEQKKEPFDSITALVWSGDDGAMANPFKTPVVFNRYNSYGLTTLKKPLIAVDSYSDYPAKTSNKPPDTTPEKALKFVITTYDVGKQCFDIPLYARDTDAADTTAISYSIEWKKGTTTATAQGSKAISLSGGAAWNPLTEGQSDDFYQYKAGLALQPGKRQMKKTLTVTKGSRFYLNAMALARTPTVNYAFDFSSKPVNIVSVTGFAGEIKGEEFEFTEQGTGKVGDKKSLPINKAVTNPDLKEDDLVATYVELQADAAANGAQITVYGDEANPLTLTVVETKELETPLPNVVATMSATVDMCAPPGHKEGCEQGVFTYEDMTGGSLPTFSKSLNAPRTFELDINFQAEGASASRAKMRIDAPGINNLDYPESFGVPGTVKVTGEGKLPDAGEISIYLWQEGGLAAIKPWQTLKHGAVDYAITASGTDTEGNTKKDVFSYATAEAGALVGTGDTLLYAKDTKELPVVSLNGQALPYVYDKKEHHAKLATPLEPGKTAELKAEHRKTGTLTKDYKVVGAVVGVQTGEVFTPGIAKFERTFSDTTPGDAFTIMVDNKFDKEISVTVETPRISQKSGTTDEKTGDRTIEEAGFFLDGTESVYNEEGTQQPPIEGAKLGAVLKIPAKGYGLVALNAGAKSSICNGVTAETTVTVKPQETDLGLTPSYAFPLSFSCVGVTFGAGAKTCKNGEECPEGQECDTLTGYCQPIEGAGGGPGDFTPENNVHVWRDPTTVEGIRTGEETMPCQITTKGAWLCDADQLAAAIEDLYTSEFKGTAQEAERYFAFADDKLTLPVIREVTQEADLVKARDGKPADAARFSDTIVSFAEGASVGCGRVHVRMYYNKDTENNAIVLGKVIEISNKNAGGTYPWCDGANLMHFMGALNRDDTAKGVVGGGAMQYGFVKERTDATKLAEENFEGEVNGFKQTVQSLLDSDYKGKWVLSSDEDDLPLLKTITEAQEGSTPFSFWYSEFDCPNAANEKLGCPPSAGGYPLDWLYTKFVEDDTKQVAGYLDYSAEDNTYRLGVVRKPNYPTDNLALDRTCFLANLINAASTGKTSFENIDGTVELGTTEQVVNLDGCKMPKMTATFPKLLEMGLYEKNAFDAAKSTSYLHFDASGKPQESWGSTASSELDLWLVTTKDAAQCWVGVNADPKMTSNPAIMTAGGANSLFDKAGEFESAAHRKYTSSDNTALTPANAVKITGIKLDTTDGTQKVRVMCESSDERFSATQELQVTRDTEVPAITFQDIYGDIPASYLNGKTTTTAGQQLDWWFGTTEDEVDAAFDVSDDFGVDRCYAQLLDDRKQPKTDIEDFTVTGIDPKVYKNGHEYVVTSSSCSYCSLSRAVLPRKYSEVECTLGTYAGTPQGTDCLMNLGTRAENEFVITCFDKNGNEGVSKIIVVKGEYDILLSTGIGNYLNIFKAWSGSLETTLKTSAIQQNPKFTDPDLESIAYDESYSWNNPVIKLLDSNTPEPETGAFYIGSTSLAFSGTVESKGKIQGCKWVVYDSNGNKALDADGNDVGGDLVPTQSATPTTFFTKGDFEFDTSALENPPTFGTDGLYVVAITCTYALP